MQIVRALLLMFAMVLLPMSSFAMPGSSTDHCCSDSAHAGCSSNPHPLPASADMHCCQSVALANPQLVAVTLPLGTAPVWNPHRDAAVITHTPPPPEHPPRTLPHRR